ncbi:hypothetical protein [Soehngenia longivitae]|jgi:hypothetical protein|nr:hypothetical protein [Soehngenia longivitae]
MKKGNIKCECGQEFYYETIRDFVVCIKCGKRHELKIEFLEDIGEVGD